MLLIDNIIVFNFMKVYNYIHLSVEKNMLLIDNIIVFNFMKVYNYIHLPIHSTVKSTHSCIHSIIIH